MHIPARSRGLALTTPLLAAMLMGPWALGDTAGTLTPAGDAPAQTAITRPNDAAALVQRAWSSAKGGRLDVAMSALSELPVESGDPRIDAIRAAVGTLSENLAKRETTRATEIAKTQKKLEELMAGESTNINLGKALREAVTLLLLSTDKPEVVASPAVQELIKRADAAAHAAESAGNWIDANELFGRLHLLLEEDGRYKPDSRRLIDRLGMLRLYVPQTLWEMRNARREEERKSDPKLSALPPFNATGEDYSVKLKGINRDMVMRALQRAADRHVERTTMKDLLIGGLTSIRTMVTTHDLEHAFAGLKDGSNVKEVVSFIDRKIEDYRALPGPVSNFAASSLLGDVIALSKRTVQIPEEALLHEMGNGAFDKLDEFSQIIWPDEVARFKRIMEASFVGVGIQIQLDEESQMIKVINPLEGTPAFRAGIKPGDLIKQINGASAMGMTLDQAVEQITGKSGSEVTLLLERAGEDLSVTMTRETIPIVTVKGWKRNGPKENDWDWFVDAERGIGYLRMSGFNDTTTRELLVAISQMQQKGLRGLVFDLRFNPGGLLTQAVSVANMFITDGTIVYTEAAGGVREQTSYADPSRVLLRDIPCVMLINNGSASASEIVSGALRFYTDQNQTNVIVLGDRSFGKGSVQNVIPLDTQAQMKLTTQYYKLPSGQLIHRRPGAKLWGVQPHLLVEMLPQQITDALLLRQDADVPGGRAKPKKKDPEEKSVLDGPSDPDRLINEGIDLQLETALVLLRSQTLPPSVAASPAGTPVGEAK